MKIPEVSIPVLEKVVIVVQPVGAAFRNPYTISFETKAPCYCAAKIARQIEKLLREEYVADGVENIKAQL